MVNMSIKSDNIQWHSSAVDSNVRDERLGKGAILWFTGLSGSGKSTVARALEAHLVENGYPAFVLDGDNLRFGLNSDLGFSPEDRIENIRRVGEVSKLFGMANVLLLAAFISPYRADRDAIRSSVPSGRFLEIHISTSLETCAQRDPKGLYAKAMNGDIAEFTGISAPYETPISPELTLDTESLSLEECVDKLMLLLAKAELL